MYPFPGPTSSLDVRGHPALPKSCVFVATEAEAKRTAPNSQGSGPASHCPKSLDVEAVEI